MYKYFFIHFITYLLIYLLNCKLKHEKKKKEAALELVMFSTPVVNCSYYLFDHI